MSEHALPPVPLPNSYWVVPGQLLAGEYPGDDSEQGTRRRLRRLLDAGVTFFLDLTEAGEYSMLSYAPLLAEEAAARGQVVEHRRMTIRDMDVPTPLAMRAILDTIDAAIGRGALVYVHCMGGIGRTGVTVGCYLVRHGAQGDEALVAINQLRRDTPAIIWDSPQTVAQRTMVRSWREPDSAHERLRDRYRGGLLGLAAGDALGTTLEFTTPGSFSPITEIIGGGPFGLQPGQWTDDTSMALCLAESLVVCQGFNARDQMERYMRWWKHGYMSSTGRCFDIGTTTRAALFAFDNSGEPFAGSTDPHTAGNGSLMRLAPVPLAFATDPAAAIAYAADSSRTTHAAPNALDACRYMAALIVGALRGTEKDALLAPHYAPLSGLWETAPFAPAIAAIAAGSFKEKQPPAIRGSGYVVNSLEAALWAFHHSDNFRSGALLAVNLGEDADTTGAIYGQLAGAFYGASAIPPDWYDLIAMRTTIEELADKLLDLAQA